MGSSLWRLARVSVIIPMVVKVALGHMTCSIFMKHIVYDSSVGYVVKN
jgi:hypothetical protein